MELYTFANFCVQWNIDKDKMHMKMKRIFSGKKRGVM